MVRGDDDEAEWFVKTAFHLFSCQKLEKVKTYKTYKLSYKKVS